MLLELSPMFKSWLSETPLDWLVKPEVLCLQTVLSGLILVLVVLFLSGIWLSQVRVHRLFPRFGRHRIAESILLLWILAGTWSVSAQSDKSVRLDGACGFGERLQSRTVALNPPSDDADRSVAAILAHTGLAQNFTLRSADVPNAAAVISSGKRLILYNPSFMDRLRTQTATDWGATSIWAHELGHHLQGHTLQSTGSRPDLELEADRFAGFILEKMGATLEESQIAVSTFASENGSPTHPPRNQRLDAIAAGWSDAHRQTAASNQAGQESTRFMARCEFDDDPVSYYITTTRHIMACPPDSRPQIVGQLELPGHNAGAEVVWVYRTPYAAYRIHRDNGIYRMEAESRAVRIGSFFEFLPNND